MSPSEVVLALAAAALVVAASGAVATWLELRRLGRLFLPAGWKVLPDGPPLGSSLTQEALERLGLHPKGEALILYASSSCSECRHVVAALPSFRREFSAVSVRLLATEQDLADRFAEISIDDQDLARDLHLLTAPYAVLLHDGLVIRKGIVNHLEQLRLIADPRLLARELALS